MFRLRRRLSITSLFTFATLVPLLIVGVLLLFLSVRSTRQLSDSLGEQVMAQATRRVQESVRDYLQQAERTSDLLTELIFVQVMPEKNLAMWRMSMLTRLRTTPEVASIGFANADDDYVYLSRFPPELEYGIGPGTPNGTKMKSWGAYLDGRLGPPARPDTLFKVRERPWYTAAMAADGPTWTPAYTWFTSDVRPPVPQFSVAYTRVVRDPKRGRFIGVLSVDTLLTQVNTTLHDLSQPLKSFLVITDNNGNIIGSSEHGPGTETITPGQSVHDVQSPVARALSKHIAAEGVGSLRTPGPPTHVTVDGQTYWAAQSPLSLGRGTQWYVLIAIPERSILGQAEASGRWIITIGTAYITFAGLVSVLLARLLTRPMRRLAQFANDVGTGDFDRQIDVGTTSELGELSDALNTMAANLRERISLLAERDAAEQATAVKSRLIAHVSHEFRTPLNAIIGYAELLRDQAEAAARARDSADADNILTASKHLLALVENLLDLSAVEAGRLRLDNLEFPIAGLLADVAIASRPVVERNRNYLNVIPAPGDPRMTADPMRVRQILINLLANAGNFTEDGEVTLSAAVDAAAGVVHLVVQDTGRGIPADRLPQLFEPFAYVPAHGQALPNGAGAGLGLAISRQLARSLGGDIRVESSPAGTKMSVTLPLKSPAQPESPPLV